MQIGAAVAGVGDHCHRPGMTARASVLRGGMASLQVWRGGFFPPMTLCLSAGASSFPKNRLAFDGRLGPQALFVLCLCALPQSFVTLAATVPVPHPFCWPSWAVTAARHMSLASFSLFGKAVHSLVFLSSCLLLGQKKENSNVFHSELYSG